MYILLYFSKVTCTILSLKSDVNILILSLLNLKFRYEFIFRSRKKDIKRKKCI